MPFVVLPPHLIYAEYYHLHWCWLTARCGATVSTILRLKALFYWLVRPASYVVLTLVIKCEVVLFRGLLKSLHRQPGVALCPTFKKVYFCVVLLYEAKQEASQSIR